MNVVWTHSQFSQGQLTSSFHRIIWLPLFCMALSSSQIVGWLHHLSSHMIKWSDGHHNYSLVTVIRQHHHSMIRFTTIAFDDSHGLMVSQMIDDWWSHYEFWVISHCLLSQAFDDIPCSESGKCQSFFCLHLTIRPDKFDVSTMDYSTWLAYFESKDLPIIYSLCDNFDRIIRYNSIASSHDPSD